MESGNLDEILGIPSFDDVNLLFSDEEDRKSGIEKKPRKNPIFKIEKNPTQTDFSSERKLTLLKPIESSTEILETVEVLNKPEPIQKTKRQRKSSRKAKKEKKIHQNFVKLSHTNNLEAVTNPIFKYTRIPHAF